MADSVVISLLQNLTQLLAAEANLIHGVREQVKKLQNKLKTINIFLQSSEGKRNAHEMVKELVNQIREAAHEAEDVIDTFILKATKHKRKNRAMKVFSYPVYAKTLRDVSTTIESICNNINEIYSNKAMFGIEMIDTSGDAQTESPLHRRRRDVEEDDVVGFDKEAKQLVKQLMEGDREPQRDVISIIGMGGLGKTTLARKIYKDTYVDKHFTCRAWVYVSQQYKIRELLLRIIKDVRMPGEIHSMDDVELKERLSTHLKDKRYLIVMDDVWNPELWDEVKASFPDNLKGSRIMITSREKKVALHASPKPPHFLQFLNEADSWKLFSKKVFRGENCPPDLQMLGRQMAKSCCGLPLSIVVLGGLLATMDMRRQTWSDMAKDVNRFLIQETDKCSEVLALSYVNLPRQLKSCFLYIGAFPEDFEISARNLIRLWIVEGFIQQIGGRNMEDTAERYLLELIDRSLVQVARRRTDGGLKTCRIHDLLRDFCISQAMCEKFLEVHMNDSSSSSKPRRLSIYCSTVRYISSNPCDSSCIRSFLCFGRDDLCLFTKHWKSLQKGFKLVRVLDLGSVVVDSVPDAIQKLIHLRYLRMNAPSLNNIPSSICNLLNLQTLDMRGSRANYLPKGIWKMQQLRHVYLSGPVKLPALPSKDKTVLPNLQILSTVAPDGDTMRLIDEERFPNVTKLGLCSYRNCATQNFLMSLPCLRFLQTLKIMELSLLTESMDSFSPTLTKITLVGTKLDPGNIAVLGKLPKLQILKLLQGAFNECKYDWSAGGFPELEVLHMVKLNIMNWSLLGEGAMQKLMRVVIKECSRLREVPDELWCLTTLRDVEVLCPSPRLATRLQQLEKKDGRNILIYSPS